MILIRSRPGPRFLGRRVNKQYPGREGNRRGREEIPLFLVVVSFIWGGLESKFAEFVILVRRNFGKQRGQQFFIQKVMQKFWQVKATASFRLSVVQYPHLKESWTYEGELFLACVFFTLLGRPEIVNRNNVCAEPQSEAQGRGSRRSWPGHRCSWPAPF